MKRKTAPPQMFPNGDDLPLFSGTPQRVYIAAFTPRETAAQPALPGLELKMNDQPKKTNPQQEVTL